MLWTRRDLLRNSLLAGTAIGIAAYPECSHAANSKVVRVRATTDISVLDPGYMTGGVEIDVLRAVVPRLVAYKVEGDKVGWEPTDIVESISLREDGLGVDFMLKPGLPGATASAKSPRRT